MKSIIIILTIIILIKISIFLINKINSKKNFLNIIECGFNNLNNKKINLSINFIFIIIIFIIFDIELILIIPLIIKIKYKFKLINLINLFIIFIIISTTLELKNNKIKWII